MESTKKGEKKGFSRRHATPDAHQAAREAREAKQRERITRLETRTAQLAAMSPQQRLAELDARLGLGIGAKRERARLAAMLATGKPNKK